MWPYLKMITSFLDPVHRSQHQCHITRTKLDVEREVWKGLMTKGSDTPEQGCVERVGGPPVSFGIVFKVSPLSVPSKSCTSKFCASARSLQAYKENSYSYYACRPKSLFRVLSYRSSMLGFSRSLARSRYYNPNTTPT